jgi:hypothetical protein
MRPRGLLRRTTRSVSLQQNVARLKQPHIGRFSARPERRVMPRMALIGSDHDESRMVATGQPFHRWASTASLEPASGSGGACLARHPYAVQDDCRQRGDQGRDDGDQRNLPARHAPGQGTTPPRRNQTLSAPAGAQCPLADAYSDGSIPRESDAGCAAAKNDRPQ